MKYFIAAIFLSVMFVSCGPSAEELEKQRIQDSLKAEEERLDAIEDADAFIMESASDTLAEVVSDTAQ
jgi:hypothetical protein